MISSVQKHLLSIENSRKKELPSIKSAFCLMFASVDKVTKCILYMITHYACIYTDRANTTSNPKSACVK